MTKIEHKIAAVLDRLTTNPWTAFPIFILIVYILFWCTFSLGKYPMDWISSGVGLLGGWINTAFAHTPQLEWLRNLLVDGILAGVGGVLAFLPNIFILYLLLSIMESTGYMGRVAYLMDSLMHHMGLHGKSFIPMIMGFGCNVPAIMATKDIHPRKSRVVTAMIIPFMSCSGRLPVYLLVVAAFFPEHGPIVLLGIYTLGVILAVASAKVLSLLIPGISAHDTVGIKPYSHPDMHYVLDNAWSQVKEYLKKLSGPILIFSVALWLLGYFPRPAQERESTPSQQLEQSFIGHVGKAMEPVLEPIGMNWKDGVAIVSGVGAKELIVSTMGVMYSGDNLKLQDALARYHTPAGALALIVFVLLYFPCIGTFVALKHVLQSWPLTIASAINSIIIAWIMAFAVFRVASSFL